MKTAWLPSCNMAPRETHGHREIGGFCSLPVKFDRKCSAFHIIYYKKHAVRQEDEHLPAERTLFAINIPPYCTKASLNNVFSCFGEVKNVFIQKQPGQVRRETQTSLLSHVKAIKGFKVAYIVFKKSQSADKAVETQNDKIRIISTDAAPVVTGLAKWCLEYAYSYPNTNQLQREVDKFMAEFDAEKQEHEQKRKEESNADEEGWVTVTRGGRNPGAPRADGQTSKQQEANKKRKKKKDLINFYQFQYRESKREHIAQLRKKFEEDKSKISQMKAARKFRPY